jgi:hypothetical protein
MRFRSFWFEVGSSMLRSPPIDLCTWRKIGTSHFSTSSIGIQRQVHRQILYIFYLVFAFYLEFRNNLQKSYSLIDLFIMLSKPLLSLHTFVFQMSFVEFVSIVKLCYWFRSCSWLSLIFASWILVLLHQVITSRSDLSLSSSVFWLYLTHTNLDFYVLVLSGKMEKLSTTLVFIGVLVNAVIVVKIAVGLNLFAS